MGHALVIDIETVTPDFDSLPEKTKSYLIERELKASTRSLRGASARAAAKKAAKEQLFLAPGMSRVICIGMRRTDKKQGLLLLENQTPDFSITVESKHRHGDDYVILDGDESFILNTFWEKVSSAEKEELKLVTFRGEAYDIPVILYRSAILGIRASVNILSSRYGKGYIFHQDLDNILTVRGATRHYSLDYWCSQFNIPSPKEGGVKGALVQKAYIEGKLDDIGMYCMRDVRSTLDLYQKLDDTIMPLFL